jgi:ATP-binding cassette subfamily B protein
MDCDEIIVLDHGKIIERGTHEELVAMKQKYYEIYSEQYSNILNSI